MPHLTDSKQSNSPKRNQNFQINQPFALTKNTQSNLSAQFTQPHTFNNPTIEPAKRYNTRGVNLYNKFSATLHPDQASSSTAPTSAHRKSQYSHIFYNHVIEDSSSDSDTDNNNSSGSEPHSDQEITDDENSSIEDNNDDEERKCRTRHTSRPQFQLCCHGGNAELPLLQQPPPLLQHLLFNKGNSDSQNYQAHTRIYNSMFAFTSPGMQLNDHDTPGKGPPTLRIQGQVCHRIGSLLPPEGQPPKFAQLYIYDTENEVKNKMQHFKYTIC
ncbi:helicase-like protein [Trifolium pratense]|uniref:Helicase-like protein n=1 Tax=Trifolium pratense TaxID=57577 RepID=A0A2K3P5U8_TRIPR|nr:helicase-like protein [Trifolium pratense]